MKTPRHTIVYEKEPCDVIEEKAKVCIREILNGIELTYDTDEGQKEYARLRKSILDSVNIYKREVFKVILNITGVHEIVLRDAERKLER